MSIVDFLKSYFVKDLTDQQETFRFERTFEELVPPHRREAYEVALADLGQRVRDRMAHGLLVRNYSTQKPYISNRIG